MASCIRILSDLTINQIAAGEVVENASSVIKELVENSLDAQSTEITVEICGGGRQLIRVTDNGSGMTQDDALLCLERHATSKIQKTDDLLSLSTMGFRGEALPSIAAVSKFTLLTCPRQPENAPATMVAVEGGKILQCQRSTRSAGTTIEVRNLFFNTPARKAFLRSPQLDGAEVQRVLKQLAFSYLHVRFRLFADGSLLWDSPISAQPTAHGALLERIQQLIGAPWDLKGVPHTAIDETFPSLRIWGWLADPMHHRQNRTGQLLLINGRAVQSAPISAAVLEGFGTRLPIKRYPLFALNLCMPASDVDVNVHPQKLLVRLRYEEQLKSQVIHAVDSALQKLHRQTPLLPPSRWQPPPSDHAFSATPLAQEEGKISPPATPKASVRPPVFERSWVEAAKAALGADDSEGQEPQETSSAACEPELPFYGAASRPLKPLSMLLVCTLPGMLLLNGQGHDLSWLLPADSSLCLLLLHQRRAHLRILFERALEKGTQEEKNLLIQGTLPFFPSGTEAPLSLHSSLQKKIIQEAISASKRLSKEEAINLLEQLQACKIPGQCPWGKRIFSALSAAQLEELLP